MIPANVTAELIAPEVVSDRAVQLDPPYQGGPQLAPGAVIPLRSHRDPGVGRRRGGPAQPAGRRPGAQRRQQERRPHLLLNEVAKQFAGNGPDFQSAIVNLSKVFQGLAQLPPAGIAAQQAGVAEPGPGQQLRHLHRARQALNDVSGHPGDRPNPNRQVLSNLQQLLGNLTHFIDTNQAALGSSVGESRYLRSDLGQRADELAKVFELTPLSIQNLNNAIDLQAPGGPALRARFNPLPDTTQAFAGCAGTPCCISW